MGGSLRRGKGGKWWWVAPSPWWKCSRRESFANGSGGEEEKAPGRWWVGRVRERDQGCRRSAPMPPANTGSALGLSRPCERPIGSSPKQESVQVLVARSRMREIQRLVLSELRDLSFPTSRGPSLPSTPPVSRTSGSPNLSLFLRITTKALGSPRASRSSTPGREVTQPAPAARPATPPDRESPATRRTRRSRLP
jgi:hypothetical protein